jgi:hypothetical protein
MNKIDSNNSMFTKTIQLNNSCLNRDQAFSFRSFIDAITNKTGSNTENDEEKENNEKVSDSIQVIINNRKIDIEYVVSHDNEYYEEEDNNINQGVSSEVQTVNHNASDIQSQTSQNTAYTVAQLARLYETALAQSIRNRESSWKFTFCDPGLNKVELNIEKVRNNNLVVTMSTNTSSSKIINQVIESLHKRLAQKGWISQINSFAKDDPVQSVQEKGDEQRSG